MNSRKIIALFSLLFVLCGNQAFAGKHKNKKAPTATTAKVASETNNEKKEAVQEVHATAKNIVQETNTLSQKNDVTLYNGASNLCGWYAVWHTHQMLNTQPLSERSNFEHFYFKESKPTFSEEKENLTLSKITQLIQDHALPNTCAIAIGSHGEIYEGKASFESLNVHNPIGIIALTTEGHWIGLRADIDTTKNPSTDLITIHFADSHDDNVMESKEAFPTATRNAIQAVYDQLVTNARQSKVSEAKASATPATPPLIQAINPTSSSALSPASTASSSSSPASATAGNDAKLSHPKTPALRAHELQQAKSLFAQAKRYEKDRNFGAAFKLYEQAAVMGYALAQIEMGNYLYYNCYSNGSGLTRNVKEAVTWYERVEEKYKDTPILYILSKVYTYGDTASGTTPNPQKALQYALLATDEKYLPPSGYDYRNYRSYMEANEQLGRWYLNGTNGCIKDEKTAHKHFTIAYQYCKKIEIHKHTPKDGRALTLHIIGYFHETGYGTKQNCTEAIAYYKRAANAGANRAYIALGDLFMQGKVDATSKKELVKPNVHEAYAWFCAAKQKPDVALEALDRLFKLGNKVGDGNGVAVDLDLAIKCFAQGDDFKFLTNLGWCYQARARKTTDEHASAEDYKASFKAYKRATELNPNDNIAWYNLGIRYEKGQGTAQDIQQAWLCYQKAIALKHANAHIALGNLIKQGFDASGKQAAPDPLAAIVQYKKALAYPHVDSKIAFTNLCILGSNLDTGTDKIKKDQKLAALCFTACADHHTPDANACRQLARYYFEGIVYPKDYKKAFELCKKATELNLKSGVAWYNLGYFYHIGKGTEQDLAQAISCYKTALDNGYTTAVFENLGSIYEQKEELELAIQYYNLALPHTNIQDRLKRAEESLVKKLETTVDNKNYRALIKLSDLHANPQSTQFNQEKAVYYLTKAAVLGDDQAQYKLAQWHECGLHGLPSDFTIAFRWYRVAGISGNDDAKRKIGQYYEEGKNVEKNLNVAAQWYSDIKNPTPGDQVSFNRVTDVLKRATLSTGEQATFAALLQQTEVLEKEALKNACALQTADVELEKIVQATQYWPLNITMTPPDDINHKVFLAEAQWRRGMWYPKNSQEQQQFYACAAENKHPIARWYQATNSSVANCYHNPFNDLQFACQHNYTPAWYNMGRCYQEGQGVSLDLTQAQMCYQRVLDAKTPAIATIERDIQVTCKLAKIAYEDGLRIKDSKSLSDAITSFSKAAAMGYIPAFYRLSQCYADDAITFNKALYYCLIAAQYGNANAQYMLGQWFMAGKIGQRRDTISAFAWYELAVANGSREALFPLAECYANGHGTKKEITTAVAYYTKAAYQFDSQAIKALLEHYNSLGDHKEAAHWQELLDEEVDNIDDSDGKDAKTASANPSDVTDDQEDDIETEQKEKNADAKDAASIQVGYEDKSASEKQICQFNTNIQKQLRATIKQFTKDPLNKENALDIKKLKKTDNIFRIRCGKQRILFKFISGNYVITNIERRNDTTYSKMG